MKGLATSASASASASAGDLFGAYIPPPPPLSHEALKELHGNVVTLVGFGSLLSETSSRSTFPTLTNFRFGRIEGYRRVFRHPAAIFYEREIARPETLEVCSLSAEAAPGSGFICSLFEVPDFQVNDYINREEEFDFAMVKYMELENEEGKGEGLMCINSTDHRVEARWGEGYMEKKYGIHGVETIWGWEEDSGILPCPIYLRHCVLAAQKAGGPAYTSFLQETYLADRKTTIEYHLMQRPGIMTTVPPSSVANRYTG